MKYDTITLQSDIIANESTQCYYETNNGNNNDFDCYSSTYAASLADYIQSWVDYQEINFEITKFNTSSFSASVQQSGEWEISIPGLGKGHVKNDKFDHELFFIFDDANKGNYGKIKMINVFSNGDIFKKVMKWSLESVLAKSISSISRNIDNFNGNNEYIYVDKSVVFLCVALSGLLIVCMAIYTIMPCVCSKYRKIEIFDSDHESKRT